MTDIIKIVTEVSKGWFTYECIARLWNEVQGDIEDHHDLKHEYRARKEMTHRFGEKEGLKVCFHDVILFLPSHLPLHGTAAGAQLGVTHTHCH